MGRTTCGDDEATLRAGPLGARVVSSAIAPSGAASMGLVDAQGRTCLAVVETERTLTAAAIGAVHAALALSASMKDVVETLRSAVASRPRSEGALVALAVVRFSANAAWAEILGAGTPPVLCLRADGSRFEHVAQSGAVTPGGPMRHPSVITIVRGPCVWLVATPGMVGGFGRSDAWSLAESLELDAHRPRTASPAVVGLEHRKRPGGVAVTATLALRDD